MKELKRKFKCTKHGYPQSLNSQGLFGQRSNL